MLSKTEHPLCIIYGILFFLNHTLTLSFNYAEQNNHHSFMLSSSDFHINPSLNHQNVFMYIAYFNFLTSLIPY